MFTEDELSNLEYCINLAINELHKDALKVFAFGHHSVEIKTKMENLGSLLEKVRTL